MTTECGHSYVQCRSAPRRRMWAAVSTQIEV